MDPRFEQFIRERQYLQNVTPETVQWYERSLKWLPSPAPTEADLKEAVIRMREKRNPAGCNCALRCINAFLKWSGSPLRVPKLKEPKLVLPTFTAVQVSRLVNWKPRTRHEKRLHVLVLFLLDTGCRISEALNLRVRDLDLDNLLVTLDGKGRKQRLVPFSFELRRALYRYLKEANRQPDLLLFANRTETALTRRNVLRGVKALCRRLGFEPPARTLHSFRHSFAANYVRKGGSLFHLQKCLGHSSLEMVRRYVALQTADLQAVHQRVSLLTSRRD